jgi:hypothetical protein
VLRLALPAPTRPTHPDRLVAAVASKLGAKYVIELDI